MAPKIVSRPNAQQLTETIVRTSNKIIREHGDWRTAMSAFELELIGLGLSAVQIEQILPALVGRFAAYQAELEGGESYAA